MSVCRSVNKRYTFASTNGTTQVDGHKKHFHMTLPEVEEITILSHGRQIYIFHPPFSFGLVLSQTYND